MAEITDGGHGRLIEGPAAARVDHGRRVGAASSRGRATAERSGAWAPFNSSMKLFVMIRSRSCCGLESTTGTGDFSVTASQKMKVEHRNLSGVSRCEELMAARDGQCPLFFTELDIRGGAVECLRMTPSRHSSGRSTNGRNRPETAIHWSHSEWPLTEQKAVVGPTCIILPQVTHSGKRNICRNSAIA